MTYHFEKSGALKPYTAEELAAADHTSSVLVLDQGTLDNGVPYWAYLAVRPSKYAEFMEFTAARKPIRLTEYGVILEYGLDAEVPADVQQAMKQKHGFDNDYKAKLIREIKKAQAEFLENQENKRIGDIVAMLKKQSGN